MWKPAEALPLSRIQIASLGRGWTVGEVSLAALT